MNILRKVKADSKLIDLGDSVSCFIPRHAGTKQSQREVSDSFCVKVEEGFMEASIVKTATQ